MYKPSDPKIWSGRVDELDGRDGYRWHQIVKCVNPVQDDIPSATKNIALLGFACDEGVRRNKGRVGAIEGPAQLRKVLANLADHFPDGTILYDAGDVVCQKRNMEQAQYDLAKQVQSLLDKNCFPILFGGGHEIAYGHFLGIAAHLADSSKKIGIINFDAHFDLRSYEAEGTSGTPFLQISKECEKRNQQISYMVLGIQPAGNTKALFKTAEKLGVNYLTTTEISQKSREELKIYLNKFMVKQDYIYLTICLDVVAAPFAPGVSAPALSGLMPDTLLCLIDHIITFKKVKSCDIAELNPKYDIDDRTAKLGAAIVYNISVKI